MNRQGTSLVELLVALQLLVLGMGGVAGLVVGSVRSTHHARRVDGTTPEQIIVEVIQQHAAPT